MQAGVTCRNARTASELCLTKEQWRRHDSKQQAGLWLDKSESDTSTNVNNSWSVGTGQMTDILLYTGN
jgi:hypothetical protein